MKNIDEQIEEVTLHNKWFELTGIEISPEIAVFLRWAFKLIQKERKEALFDFARWLYAPTVDYDYSNLIKKYLSQTKGGKDE